MIKLENYEVVGWEHAIRGMRNPMNSWEKSDSLLRNCDKMECDDCMYHVKNDGLGLIPSQIHILGPNDHDLMMRLAKGGPVHAKYRRMITVYVDITAPLYWWKEFDTYKVGTVANSCSTMHKIHAKEFEYDDFSWEHLSDMADEGDHFCNHEAMEATITALNYNRKKFIETKNKAYFDAMIQLLPSSYNQKRTVMLNYEVLANIYEYRRNHKLDEWHVVCDWIESLPYSEIITGGKDEA